MSKITEDDLKRFNNEAQEAYNNADTHYEGMQAVFEYATKYERERVSQEVAELRKENAEYKEREDFLLRQGQRASKLFEERVLLKRFIKQEIEGCKKRRDHFNNTGIETAAAMDNGMMTAYNNVLRLMESEDEAKSALSGTKETE